MLKAVDLFKHKNRSSSKHLWAVVWSRELLFHFDTIPFCYSVTLVWYCKTDVKTISLCVCVCVQQAEMKARENGVGDDFL